MARRGTPAGDLDLCYSRRGQGGNIPGEGEEEGGFEATSLAYK